MLRFLIKRYYCKISINATAISDKFDIPSSLYRTSDINPVTIPVITEQHLDSLINFVNCEALLSQLQRIKAAYIDLKSYNDEINAKSDMLTASQVRILKRNLSKQRMDLYSNYLRLPNCYPHRLLNCWGNNKSEEESGDAHVTVDPCTILENKVQSQFTFETGILSSLKFVLLEHTFDHFLSTGFMAVSQSDIVKTPSVEACNPHYAEDASSLGLASSRFNHRTSNTITTINQYSQQFLVGSASVQAFCGLLMRHCVTKKSFPCKLVTLGNRYESDFEQSRVVSGLIITEDADLMLEQTEMLLREIERFWRGFIRDCEFDLRMEVETRNDAVRKDLRVWESAKYGVYLGDVEVARISVIGDYLSRKLKIESYNKVPCHMVYAEIINFNSLTDAISRMNKPVKFSYKSDWISEFLK